NTGHASTSVSAAMGIAEARTIRGEDFHVVCVIGDGSLTGGLAYEGLENVGNRKSNLIVILNDNEMSISPNTGSVAQHLSRLRSSQAYQRAKQQFRERTQSIPKVGQRVFRGAERIKEIMRYAVVPGSLFEDLGFTYFGPVDGHNVRELVSLFEAVKQIEGPTLIHVVTRKGKGYRNAEQNPEKFHAIGAFDSETGIEKSRPERCWSDAAGDALLGLAQEDERICAISAAMTDAVGLSAFAADFPGRFYDVGIAEEHAVTFAAGLAIGGLRPFVHIYSTFLQRAYDQILMDVCAQNLPVVFMIDRAGNVGKDGETHHGVFDLSYLMPAPNLTLMAPSDEGELQAMMRAALEMGTPVAIRYPRGAVRARRFGWDADPDQRGCDAAATAKPPIQRGVSARRLPGTDVEVRALGKMVQIALDAAALLGARGISCGVVDERFVKPLGLQGEDGLLSAGERCRLLVTIEDNVATGGFGEAVCAALNESGAQAPELLTLAWPDAFLPQGDVDELFALYGLDAPSVAEKIEARLADAPPAPQKAG
ncbi:MAG: 1-deoxy-D-xylulose-5-phosphate synthase, partial [Clostridiales bacterium]|nr:1-deoxy-D-xylulose-5-phosphate synthase [Clostridiales bacterium]